MKITKVVKVGDITHVFIEHMHDNCKYTSEYRRINKDDWETLTGQKWKTAYLEHLESMYQSYLLAKQAKNTSDAKEAKEEKMKITKVVEVGCIAYISLKHMYDNGSYNSEYRRIAKDNWEMLVGKKWEHTYFEPLEAVYQDYLSAKNTSDAKLLAELEVCYKIISIKDINIDKKDEVLAQQNIQIECNKVLVKQLNTELQESNKLLLKGIVVLDSAITSLIQEVSTLKLDKANLQLLNDGQANLIEKLRHRIKSLRDVADLAD